MQCELASLVDVLSFYFVIPPVQIHLLHHTPRLAVLEKRKKSDPLHGYLQTWC